MTQPEHTGHQANLAAGMAEDRTGILPGRPAHGTGRITLAQNRDGWEGNWSDGQGHILVGPSPSTFPDILEWARRLPAPEILILTGYGPVRE